MVKAARTRRESLALLAGAGSLAVAPVRAQGQAQPAFGHGVASGDPGETSLVIWTRLTTSEETAVAWHVAHDPEFSTVVQAGRGVAGRDRDHTVMVVVEGLVPGSTYYYRFRAQGETSPASRTRTLPDSRLERLGVAHEGGSTHRVRHFDPADRTHRAAGRHAPVRGARRTAHDHNAKPSEEPAVTTSVETLIVPELCDNKGRWGEPQASPPVTASDIRKWAIATYWPQTPPPIHWNEAPQHLEPGPK